MSYVEGFVVPVPAANKETFRKHAADAAPMFKEFGATRMVEAWGDNVPDGKLTDFKGAVKAKPDEVVVFSWFEYPDKAARDAANEKMMSDPRMKQMGANMPFDGQRMIFGGFAPSWKRAPAARWAMPMASWCRFRPPTRMPTARWPPRPRGSSRNTAPRGWSKRGATTCPTARSPISRAR